MGLVEAEDLTPGDLVVSKVLAMCCFLRSIAAYVSFISSWTNSANNFPIFGLAPDVIFQKKNHRVLISGVS